MELTELKNFKNAGGSVYSSIGSSGISKTAEHKWINNLPKFAEGTPGTVDTSGIKPNAYAQTTYGTSSVKQYFSSPAATIGARSVHAPTTPSNGGRGGQKSMFSGNETSSGINTEAIGGVITSGIKFAGDTINAFSVNETPEEIAARQGSSQMSIGGVGYESQNSIDISKELESVKKQNVGNTLATVGSGAGLGAAVGSVIPGLGTAVGSVIGAGVGLITGIFGGESRKRRYREMLAKQNAKINALQDSSRFSAQTKAIQLQNAREYGNSESQYLYGAKNGMLPKYNNGTPSPDLSNIQLVKPGQKLADSTFGKVDAFNSYASNGEVAVEDGVMRKLGKGKDNNDTLPFFATGKTAIFPNKGEEKYGIDISDYVWNTGDVNGGLLMLKDHKQNMNKNSMYAKNGRLPKFDNGWLGNVITSGLGVIGGASQYLGASNSEPRKTKVYRSNDYEGVSLDILSRLGISPFPTMQNLRNAEARANRAIDMSGGLTTGQRTLTRLASLNNTQRAVADALQNIQMQNNNYFADYAKTALAAGAANAQRAMQANMYDEEMYAKAHAARQQGMQMGTWNMLNQLQQYWANEFKRQQFNETMGLYKQDQKLRADEIQALLNGNSSLAKNMYDYTKKRMGDYMIGKAATNPMFNPTKATTYKNLTGKWLAGYNFNQKPSIPYIKTR